NTIVFSRTNDAGLLRVAATAGGVSPFTTLAPGQSGHRFPSARPEGRSIVFLVDGALEVQGAYEDPVAGGTSKRLLTFPNTQYGGSPDGRCVAFSANPTGRDEAYIVPFQREGGTVQLSVTGGRLPR